VRFHNNNSHPVGIWDIAWWQLSSTSGLCQLPPVHPSFGGHLNDNLEITVRLFSGTYDLCLRQGTTEASTSVIHRFRHVNAVVTGAPPPPPPPLSPPLPPSDPPNYVACPTSVDLTPAVSLGAYNGRYEVFSKTGNYTITQTQRHNQLWLGGGSQIPVGQVYWCFKRYYGGWGVSSCRMSPGAFRDVLMRCSLPWFR
jgi:hypothetical protein